MGLQGQVVFSLTLALSVAELLHINDTFARQNELQGSQAGSAGPGAWQRF